MFPSRFRYEAPHSLDEAIALLRDGGDYVKVLAGGQSLVPMMKLRFASPDMLVDINNVAGLAYHRADPDGSLRIGALCRHTDLEFSSLLGYKDDYLINAPAAGTTASIPRHFRLDARLGWTFRPGWQVFVSGQELLQKQFSEFADGTATPRTFRAGFTGRFGS